MDFLVEDSTTEKVPDLLAFLINKLCQTKEQDVLQKDLLFVIIVVLMIENGMIPVDENKDIIDPMSSIDSKQLIQWKTHTGLYESLFVMRGLKNLIVKLIMSPLGAISVVNVVIDDINTETYTICLPISRYIVSPLAKTIPMKFRELKHMCTMFKNKIICPVKSRILSFHGYASASLIGLPEEILFNIVFLLPINDILNLYKTCTRIKYILDNETLWHELVIRDFNCDFENDDTEWKKMYKIAYHMHLQNQPWSSTRSGTLHDYMDYSDFVSYIDNPMWDII